MLKLCCSGCAVNVFQFCYYGLEACLLRKADLNVLDFVVNRFFMKLFRTNNIGMVKEYKSYFLFQLPSKMLKQRIVKIAVIRCVFFESVANDCYYCIFVLCYFS